MSDQNDSHDGNVIDIGMAEHLKRFKLIKEKVVDAAGDLAPTATTIDDELIAKFTEIAAILGFDLIDELNKRHPL